ncbi:MAG TPA: flagellar M-ring protein FliF C-terminal domain-containing protein, partial [Ramlibacter sp.]|nr:flagellar M-ring protein FliF C-terminal domain-containing protein [Ramlibacter sp.]
DSAAPEARDGRPLRGSSSQRDVEYQTGRRVEQVVSPAGSIRRIHAVVLLRQAPDARRRDEVRELVAAAIGASPERGDVVVVQGYASPQAPTVATGEQAMQDVAPPRPAVPTGLAWQLAGAGAALALLVLALAVRRKPRRQTSVQALDERDRQLALRRVEAWLHEAEPAPLAGARRA